MSAARFLPTRYDAGIFLVSLVILLYELLLTRIFSVTMFYHFSFLAVSLAMMGLGLSGLLVHLFPLHFRKDNISKASILFSAVFAVSGVAAVGAAFLIPVEMATTAENWRNVLIILLLCLVPLTAGGVIIAHLLARNAERANRLYCFDLVGAGFGCLAFVPMTNWFGAPSAVLFTSALAAFAGVILGVGRVPGRSILSAVLTVILVAAGVANLSRDFFDVRYVKGRRQEPTLVVRWNSFSRVEVKGTPQDMHSFRRPLSWGFSTTLQFNEARELYLKYDAEALTQIVGFRGDLEKVRYLLYDVTAAPYVARGYDDVLIIGAGGGRDVLTALTAKASQITAVEINPLIIDLMRSKFRDFTGGLYTDYANVRVVHADGRNHVRSAESNYDLIQASLVDTWAASAAGAYSLVENSLYTVDAFKDYFDRLAPNGVLSFSRWYGLTRAEVLRLIAIAKEALRERGITDAGDHFYIVRTRSELTGVPSLATILIKSSAFTARETERLNRWADQMRFAVSYSPAGDGDRGNDPLISEIIRGQDTVGRAASVEFDLSPVDDDRPFFFDRVPLLAWIAHRLGLPAPSYGAGELTMGGQTLLIALASTLFFTLILLLVPLAGLRKRGAMESGEGLRLRRALTWVTYFGFLGFGFIVVEIVLIQRFNLYLGNPVYSLSVVLFTILVSGGIGSFIAGRWQDARHLLFIVLAAGILLLLYHLSLPEIIERTLGLPVQTRVFVAAFTLAPLACVMGMPFPTGLRLVARESTGLVSWAWAINGGTSVFGSVCVVLISMSFGFRVSFLVGFGAYVGASAVVGLLNLGKRPLPA